MTTRVVDASVAIKWVLNEDHSLAAAALLDSDHALVAPAWMLVEVANILWKRARRGELTPAEAARRLAALQTLTPLLIDPLPLLTRAHDLALALAHPVYDMLYLAVAEQTGGVLVTADERLVRAVQGTRWASSVERLW